MTGFEYWNFWFSQPSWCCSTREKGEGLPHYNEHFVLFISLASMHTWEIRSLLVSVNRVRVLTHKLLGSTEVLALHTASFHNIQQEKKGCLVTVQSHTHGYVLYMCSPLIAVERVANRNEGFMYLPGLTEYYHHEMLECLARVKNLGSTPPIS